MMMELKFGKRAEPQYKTRYYAEHRERLKAASRNRSRRPEIKARNKALGFKRLYGITMEKYSALLSEQGGVCAICRRVETSMYRGQIKMLSVDHDHETGAVRGLLCVSCNVMLGAAKDDAGTLRRAVMYLSEINTGG